jgi:hypothetical protein
MIAWFVTTLRQNAEFTYAIGNVLLTVWGTVIVAIFASKTAA